MKHSIMDNKHLAIILQLTLKNTNHLELRFTLKTQSRLGSSISKSMTSHTLKLTILKLLRIVEISLFQKLKGAFI